MKTKAKTAAELADDRLVFDRPFTLLRYDMSLHRWAEAYHLHASINRAAGTGGQNPAESAHTARYLFRVRYFAALEDIRENIQHYRISCGGSTYEPCGYDDYSERHRVIKLTADRIRTGTVTLISGNEAKDSIGQIVPAETRTVLPCTEYETTQDERADAFQIGLRLAFRLRIFRDEYSGERFAEYVGKRFCIGAVRYAGDAADLYLGERTGS